MNVIRSYKTEIKPNKLQKEKINKTLGVCRHVYNMFVLKVQEEYAEGNYMDGMRFSKWLNNEYIPNNPDKKWIKEVSSKAVKQSIMNGDKAFKRFFKGLSGFPNLKKKKDQNSIKAYFPKNNKRDWEVERHRVKIPSLGWVRLKEFGYIPTNLKVKSGTVSIKAGRYYVSVLYDIQPKNSQINDCDGIGIDMGIKDFLILSNGKVYPNINKTQRIKKLERQLLRQNRIFSRKHRLNKDNEDIKYQNIYKQRVKIQKTHSKLSHIRNDYINKTVNELVKSKPKYITIEHLDIQSMIKNKFIANQVLNMSLYRFTVLLQIKCEEYGIELRRVDRYYPSSKLCSNCGFKKQTLKLSDRTYKCDNCKTVIDRDFNASLNLKYAKEYMIITNV